MTIVTFNQNHSVRHILNSVHRGVFSANNFLVNKGLFHCQNDQSNHSPAGRLLESTLNVGFIAGSGFFSDEEVDIYSGYNHPAVVVQPFFISTVIDYLILKKLMGRLFK